MKVKVEDLIARIEAAVVEAEERDVKRRAKQAVEFKEWKVKTAKALKAYVALIAKKDATTESICVAMQRVGIDSYHGFSVPDDGTQDDTDRWHGLTAFKEQAEKDISLLRLAADNTITVGNRSQFSSYL